MVRIIGSALVEAMNKAKAARRCTGCRTRRLRGCRALPRRKDHLDWELLGKCAGKLSGPRAKGTQGGVRKVEDEEDEHLYHTKGWCRELWIASLGMKAVLPPPEERHHVTTAIGAARAEQASAKSR